MSTSDASSSDGEGGITLDDLAAYEADRVGISVEEPASSDGSDSADSDYEPESPQRPKKSEVIKLPPSSPATKAAASPKKKKKKKDSSSASASKAAAEAGAVQRNMCKAAFDGSAAWKPMDRNYTVLYAPSQAMTASKFMEYCTGSDATLASACGHLAVLKKSGKSGRIVWGFLAKASPPSYEVVGNNVLLRRVAVALTSVSTGKTKWGPVAAKTLLELRPTMEEVTGHDVPASLVAEAEKTAGPSPRKKQGGEKREAEEEPALQPTAKKIATDVEAKPEEPAAEEMSFAQFAAFAARYNIAAIQFREP